MRRRLGIIGGGMMGSAIMRGALKAGVLALDDLIVAEVDSKRREAIASLGCATTEESKLAAAAEHILLAVKPQSFCEVAESLAPLRKSKVVISIMAGLSSAVIRQKLGEKARIVRVMPNTPCQIGAGMAAIALGAGARPGDEALAVSIFQALGKTAVVDESLMYAVTAVSGSGPAYVFYLAEAMEQAAIRLGIDPPTARVLVIQTVFGSGQLLGESGQSAAELRRAVTSHGGTTAAALDVMHEREFADLVIEAITAARDRGMELDRPVV